jgi:hypothetical protein
MFMELRTVFMSLALLLFVLVAASRAHAQAPSCAPPCEMSSARWLDGNAHVRLCDRYGCCDYDITYRYRMGCNFYDLEVTLVDNPAQCMGQIVDLGRLVNGAVDWLLVNNPMNFPPSKIGDCEVNIRVFKAGCWTFNVQQAALIPCGSSCCDERFTICVAADGKRQVVQTAGVSTVTTCDPGSGCYSACREYTGGVPPIQ